MAALYSAHANRTEAHQVDLSAYPDLVVIYLGMCVEEPRGLETLQTLGPQIQAANGPMFSARQRRDADRSSAAAS